MYFSNLIIILPTITSKDSTPRSIIYSSGELRELQNKVMDNTCLQVLMPGTINTIRKLRINKRRIKTSGRSPQIGHKVDKSNLVYVKITKKQDAEVQNA